MAYRSSRKKRRVEKAETGAVADMVRQFADPFAFARELVQNGIDAGASAIEVRAERGPGGMAALSVHDDGEGMTRDVIEGPLLTLFASAKEEQSGKIGKYGVGFVSVFAVEPAEVVVETWREEGSWRVVLHADHRYELSHGEERPGSGTIVRLVKALDGEAFDEHAALLKAALLRWCRHAHVPIAFSIRPGAGDPRTERIDRPLSVEAPLSVEVRDDDAHYVLGPCALDSKSFAGFYNRGLTLFETDQPPHDDLQNLRFKIDSPFLTHTLSRDNLRHDAAYDRALARVRELAREALPERIEAALRASAAAAHEKEPSARYMALVAAACRAPLELPPARLTVALTDPIGGERTCGADRLVTGGRILCASRRSPLTAALARRGVPVALAPRDVLQPLLQRRLHVPFVAPGSAYLLYQRNVQATETDARLLDELGLALKAAGARIGSIALARRYWRSDLDRPAVAPAQAGDPEPIVTADAARRWWKMLGTVEELLLDIRHDAVQAARARAASHPVIAAHLLARYLLVLEHGEIDKGSSDALLELASERLGAALSARGVA